MVLLANRVSDDLPPASRISHSSAEEYFIARRAISAACSNLIIACDQLPLYALPTVTLRNLAGAAPWPVPITCWGWPLPQLGVPHNVHSSREQMASSEFQKS